ncbi:MAG: PAS domain-containing protein [Deltaproteobacteria bacterium]|nr:PAS domain-containing protein [Deltaproteobacteria bacterium]
MSKTHTVLIVEDNVELSYYLKNLLDRNDLNVIAVDCGKKALQVMKDKTIDLVLQDIGLPDVDGYQVMNQIFRTSPETLVIVMTGEATIDSAVQALRGGAYDYLRKPFESMELINSVKNAIDRIKLEQRNKQAEEELKNAQQKLQHVLTSNPTIIYSCNPAGDCATTFISKNVTRELGYEPHEFLNDRHFWIERIHPKDVQRVKDIYSNLIERGTSVLEYRFQEKNGSYRWMRDEVRLLFDDQCKSAEVVGSWTDITDLKRVEAALRQSEKQFRDLVENSLIGISIIQDNQFVYQNPQCRKLFRPSDEKSVFKDFETVHAEDRQKVKKAYQDIMSGATGSVEIVFRFYPPGLFGNDNQIRWVHCRGTAIRYQSKDAVLLNAIDVTQSKHLEHQLIIKNKMLSLGRVAAGIAHEIRNPLTGINTYLYTIEDLCDSEQLGGEDMEIIRQIITQIQVASNKIESVIKRVMDFSKPGAPKMVRTDINESLEEAIELSAVTMRKNGIKIEKSLATKLPQCYADPHLIEQVVLNLITNAARAMEKSNGDPKLVEIKSAALNNTLRIHVADSGPGVPVELREKIFDPFFTTKEDGSGIGLNIAQRIVADHNGSITLGSSQWGGAEFTIELPIERRMNTR